MSQIPIIDVSPLHTLTESQPDASDPFIAETTNQIANACKTYGFFAITNHGVDSEIIRSAWIESSNFFDLNKSVKEEVCMAEDYPYGYENYESLGTELKYGKSNSKILKKQVSRLVDSKETFSIGPADTTLSGMPGRRFPNVPTFERALTDYYSAMENLAKTLFRGLALALQLDSNWFLQEGVFDDGHQCALRVLNYPELQYSSSEEVPIRAGAHTDYGAMTILKSGGLGLQLCLSQEDEQWIDVPHLEDAFVINLGDLMQRWTNDRWRSTLHRVVAVSDNNDEKKAAFNSCRRQSIAFFVNMNGEANVVPFESCVDEDNPMKYHAIKASEHLMQRHLRSMGRVKA